ncbi:MAG: adenylate kinase [Clostridia bacterium]|nr:adenylate kinase [Clostridia bacterium]
MRRVIVIGSPGSGKSRFSRALHQATGLPLVHLDLLYWNADQTVVSRSVFLERLQEAVSQDAWIIDGNYASTMEMRLKNADTVFWLDYPTEVCLAGLRERRGKPRPDMPWVERADGEGDAEFWEYVRHFRETNRPAILALLARYPEKNVIIFQDRQEADAFLKTLSGD